MFAVDAPSDLPTTQIMLFGFVICSLLGMLGLILKSFNGHVKQIITSSGEQQRADREMHRDINNSMVSELGGIKIAVVDLKSGLDKHGRRIAILTQKMGHELDDESDG